MKLQQTINQDVQLQKQGARMRRNFTRRRVMKFLGLPFATRRDEALAVIKDRLVMARKNNDTPLAIQYSQIKAFVKARVPTTCAKCDRPCRQTHCDIHSTTRWGRLTGTRNLATTAIVGLGLMLLAGCMSQPTVKPVAAAGQIPVVSDASGQAVGQPAGENVMLAWNRSPSPEVMGYRLWYGPSSAGYTNSVMVGQLTGATLTNLTLPTFIAATAYNADGMDSPFSDEVVVRGWVTVVTINALTNSTLNTNFVFSHTIWKATNPPTGFWKLEAVKTIQVK